SEGEESLDPSLSLRVTLRGRFFGPLRYAQGFGNYFAPSVRLRRILSEAEGMTCKEGFSEVSIYM
ncbi:MAG TPA: hypothetical protein ACFYEA_01935, partial [Candidatus Tripitaka californicus]|uniref:hypothetical protein n=1 Tax=Candidatus Tripitaka californicus TaxID=3367616 RepID=UPI004024BB38